MAMLDVGQQGDNGSHNSSIVGLHPCLCLVYTDEVKGY